MASDSSSSDSSESDDDDDDKAKAGTESTGTATPQEAGKDRAAPTRWEGISVGWDGPWGGPAWFRCPLSVGSVSPGSRCCPWPGTGGLRDILSTGLFQGRLGAPLGTPVSQEQLCPCSLGTPVSQEQLCLCGSGIRAQGRDLGGITRKSRAEAPVGSSCSHGGRFNPLRFSFSPRCQSQSVIKPPGRAGADPGMGQQLVGIGSSIQPAPVTEGELLPSPVSICYIHKDFSQF